MYIFCATISCVTEIPNSSNFEPQVFISGFLTDGSEYVTVKIQRTAPIDDLSLNPINDASISLYAKDSSGNSTLVTDTFNVSNGTYRTSEIITTIIGNTYWIEILLANGTTFKSDEEILKEEIAIGDLEITSDLNRVTFNDPISDTNFYLINFLFYRNGALVLKANELSNDVLFNGNENATFDSTEFTTDPNNLEARVSISNLNFNTYQYYLNAFSQFENQITNAGVEDDLWQVFAPSVANLTGNIMNTSSNTRALGFFGVYSTSQFVKFF